jgi:ADP-heptose:LPS heptosyltransferase
MNARGLLLAFQARAVSRLAPSPSPPADDAGRFLVIRRNRMGDMICTLPLLHALRQAFPQAHLAVACDAPGAPIATASGVVDHVIILGSIGGLGAFRAARRLQDYTCVLAAKGGFDRRLARFTRLTNAPRRIGFDAAPSIYYTDPLPSPAWDTHQIDSLLALLAPLRIAPALPAPLPRLEIPSAAREFTRRLLAGAGILPTSKIVLINISSTAPLRFRDHDFVTLAQRIAVAERVATVLFVAAPSDQPRARALAARCASGRVATAATPGPLELGALMQQASLLVTPEGGAAHFAAALGLPALVLWSEGPFEKWHSRAENHSFLRPAPDEKFITFDQVWPALQPLLGREGPASS